MIPEGIPMAKAASWAITDAESAKAWGANGIRYPGSPRPKLCLLAIGRVDPFCCEANASSRPPGKYDRKIKTQMNWRGLAQVVEHVV